MSSPKKWKNLEQSFLSKTALSVKAMTINSCFICAICNNVAGCLSGLAPRCVCLCVRASAYTFTQLSHFSQQLVASGRKPIYR